MMECLLNIMIVWLQNYTGNRTYNISPYHVWVKLFMFMNEWLIYMYVSHIWKNTRLMNVFLLPSLCPRCRGVETNSRSDIEEREGEHEAILRSL